VEQTRKRRAEEVQTVATLPPKKRGKPTLLGANLDKKVQAYIRKVREGGSAISNRVVLAAARGILLKYGHTSLLNAEVQCCSTSTGLVCSWTTWDLSRGRLPLPPTVHCSQF